MTAILRWTVWLADLDPVSGSEQAGQRPVLVISNDDFNAVMPLVTVLPVTSLKPGREIYPSEIFLKKGVANLDKDSVLLTHQIRTISKKRFAGNIGTVQSPELQAEVKNAIKLHLDLFE